MRVKIRRGTADLTCPCGDWLKHWERSTGFLAVRCGAESCAGAAERGAHVMSLDMRFPVAGVVPLCSRCWHREDDFSIREPLAPAVRESTCGRGDPPGGGRGARAAPTPGRPAPSAP